MFPFDQSALPQLTSRRAFIGVDFQNDFTAADGALPASEPTGYVKRAAELASAFREHGEVIWVKSRFDECRSVDEDKIITDDAAPSTAGLHPGVGGVRLTRRRAPPRTQTLEAAGPPDPEAFLSQDEPKCLNSSSKSACDFSQDIKEGMQKGDMTLTKSHYSAFNGTQLLLMLRAKMVMEVYICGSLANVGVYATAMDAAGHGLSITVVEDCCGYRSEDRQRQAISGLIEFTGCEIASREEVLETLKPAQPKPTTQGTKPRAEQAGSPDERSKRTTQSPGISQPLAGLRLASDPPVPAGSDAAPLSNTPCDPSASESPTKAPEVRGNNSKPTVPKTTELETIKKGNSDSSERNPPSDPERKPSNESSTDPVGPKSASKMGSNTKHKPDSGGEAFLQKGLCDGDTDIIEDLLPDDLADGIFDRLREEISWQRMSHQGGEVPRLVAVQGEVAPDGSIPIYRHPSDESPPLLPFSPTVLAIKAATEKHLGHPLNHALIQYYRSGMDYISEHSDKTLDIVKDSFIANVSLGAERTMILRTKRLDKDPSCVDDTTPQDTKRQTQRARLPHNSLCRMGLRTNMKWLHSIRQDKRAERDKDTAELAFEGGRISLTFRQIGTFLDKDETLIWGQGAKGKTQKDARPVKNGAGPEAIQMVRAFGTENHSSTFDWDAHYGEGFDVLHMSSSPRFFTSSDPEINLRVGLMLSELGIDYAKGSVGSGNPQTDGKAPDVLPIKFVDNDETKSLIEGDVAIMMYLEAVHHRSKEGDKPSPGLAVLAKVYSRFQRSLAFSAAIRRVHGDAVDEKSELKAIRQELSVWDKYAGEGEGTFLAGSEPSLPDFVVWPVLHTLVKTHGSDVLKGSVNLDKYYELYGDRDSTKKALGKIATPEQS